MRYVPTRQYPPDHPAMKPLAEWICGKCGIGNRAVNNCTKCQQVRTNFS